MSATDTRRIAREILNYFMRNPKAADTLEGIARWRLLNEAVHRKVEETRLALEWLVEHGLVLENSAVGIAIYSLNPLKIDDAKKFLAPASPKPRVAKRMRL